MKCPICNKQIEKGQTIIEIHSGCYQNKQSIQQPNNKTNRNAIYKNKEKKE